MLYVNDDGSIELTRGDTARLSVSIQNDLTGEDYIVSATDTDSPSDGKSYIDSWTETETEIVQVWTEQQTDNDPISDSEALEIITGGADI